MWQTVNISCSMVYSYRMTVYDSLCRQVILLTTFRRLFIACSICSNILVWMVLMRLNNNACCLDIFYMYIDKEQNSVRPIALVLTDKIMLDYSQHIHSVYDFERARFCVFHPDSFVFIRKKEKKENVTCNESEECCVLIWNVWMVLMYDIWHPMQHSYRLCK